MTDPSPFCRIGQAASEVGVKTHTMRFWEAEFKIRPQRSKSGQRIYTRKQVEMFKLIRSLLHEKRLTVEGARRVLIDSKQTEFDREVRRRLEEQIHIIISNRERLCSAWIAETGLLPSQSRLVERVNADGTVSVHIEKREDDDA